MVLFAGQIVTATQLNSELEIGTVLLNVTANTNSSTWNSATKVLTNLLGTFTAVAGGVYMAECKAAIQGGATVVTTGLVITFKQGGAAGIADTVCGGQPLRISEATAIVGHSVDGSFTASVAGTYGVAVCGWNPGGDTSVCKLFGDSGFSINRLTVTRVA